jgi:hypothetical protein
VVSPVRLTYHSLSSPAAVSLWRGSWLTSGRLRAASSPAPLRQAGAVRLFTSRLHGQRYDQKFESLQAERFDDRAIWELMYFDKAPLKL